MDPAELRQPKGGFPRSARRQADAVRPGPVRRIPARASGARSGDQRICLAQPVHPHDAGPSGSRRPAGFEPEFTIIDLPSFRADPERHGCRSETVIAVNLSEKLILIGGTEYGGEMKKSVFGLLNFLLPRRASCRCTARPISARRAIPRSSSASAAPARRRLSADPNRTLIGDDEHGWSDTAVFNFEGGCYAKMIRLSAESEPEIYATTKRFGTVLENVVMDPVTRALDLDD